MSHDFDSTDRNGNGQAPITDWEPGAFSIGPRGLTAPQPEPAASPIIFGPWSEPDAQPLAPDVGLLAFVADVWSDRWQPRHHLLTRLGRYFQVLWIQPPRHWRTPWKVAGERGARRTHGYNPGFEVHEAVPWLPLVYRPAKLAALLARMRAARALRELSRRGCRQVVLHLWRPHYAPMLELVPHDLSCYEMDDEYSFSDEDGPLDPAERRLIAKVDQVFAHSAALMQKKGGINPNTTFLPNGVDFQAYASAHPEPTDLAAIRPPRIGYAGYLKKQLDFQLLFELAARHPEWSFVFVGAHKQHPEVTEGVRRLSTLPNVSFLGPKSAEVLATYPRHFDVCLMPYVVNGYTRYIYPMKLHEYLAAGRPTVAAPIDALSSFDNVVTLASTADEWSQAIADALGPGASTPDEQARRQSVARGYDWGRLAARLALVVAEGLGHPVADRIRSELHFRTPASARNVPQRTLD